MIWSEWVLEVPDGEKKRDEFPESDHKSDSETSTFTSENEHVQYADILSDDIANEVENHGWHRYINQGNQDGGRIETEGEVVNDVSREQ